MVPLLEWGHVIAKVNSQDIHYIYEPSQWLFPQTPIYNCNRFIWALVQALHWVLGL